MTIRIVSKIKKDHIFQEFVNYSISRHLCGDWGETSDADKKINDYDPQFAMSAYTLNGDTIWVSQTGDVITILFPSEY